MKQSKLEKEWQNLLKKTPGLQEYSDAFNAQASIKDIGKHEFKYGYKFSYAHGNDFLREDHESPDLKDYFFWLVNEKQKDHKDVLKTSLGRGMVVSSPALIVSWNLTMLAVSWGVCFLAGAVTQYAHDVLKPNSFAKNAIRKDLKAYKKYKKDQIEAGVAPEKQDLLPRCPIPRIAVRRLF